MLIDVSQEHQKYIEDCEVCCNPIEITVTAGTIPQITVRDHGPGFPSTEIESLTTRFQRGENAKNTIGSGLGLTIAQDVATAHGGRLELANQSEGGACVTLSFPLS